MQEIFHYQPLRAEKEMRLLEIVSTGEFEDEYKLIIARLDQRDQLPPYTALSYHWGESNETATICVDNQPFYISQNLADALQSITDKVFEISRYLWVDQICINQKDQVEQSEQVRNMHDIAANCAKGWILGRQSYSSTRSSKSWWEEFHRPPRLKLLDEMKRKSLDELDELMLQFQRDMKDQEGSALKDGANALEAAVREGDSDAARVSSDTENGSV